MREGFVSDAFRVRRVKIATSPLYDWCSWFARTWWSAALESTRYVPGLFGWSMRNSLYPKMYGSFGRGHQKRSALAACQASRNACGGEDDSSAPGSR